MTRLTCSSVFASRYPLFGSWLFCEVVAGFRFSKGEQSIYHLVKDRYTRAGFEYLRIENKLQNGTPDILLYNSEAYLFIEAKYYKGRKLHSIADDLKYQPGQLAMLLQSVTKGYRHALLVGHTSGELAILSGRKTDAENIANVVGRL